MPPRAPRATVVPDPRPAEPPIDPLVVDEADPVDLEFNTDDEVQPHDVDIPMREAPADRTPTTDSTTQNVDPLVAVLNQEMSKYRKDMPSEELQDFLQRISSIQDVISNGGSVPKRRRLDVGNPSGSTNHVVALLVKQQTPKFKGKQLQDLRQWVTEVENTFKLTEITLDHDAQRTLWAMKGLDGELMRRAQAKQRDLQAFGQELSWLELQEVVRDYLSDPALRMANAAREFFHVRKRDNESLGDFETRLQTLEQNLGLPLPEETKMWFYFVKLPENIGNRMLELDQVRGTPTARKLMDDARTQEHLVGLGRAGAAQASESRRGARARGRGYTPSSSRSHDTTVKTTVEVDAASTGGSTSRQSSRRRDRGQRGSRGKGRGGGDSGQSKAAAADEIKPEGDPQKAVCYQCKEIGHLMKDCPKTRK